MTNDEQIVSCTMAEIRDKIARGEDRTDWEYLRTIADEELEASIDFAEEGVPDWDAIRSGIIQALETITLPLDSASSAWFRRTVEGTGLGYKTRVADVLREYVAAQQAAAGDASPTAPAAVSPTLAAAADPALRRAS